MQKNHVDHENMNQKDNEFPIYCPIECDQYCVGELIYKNQILATILALTCIYISSWHISKHLKYFSNPNFQAKIVIILCMAPFYCICSITSIYLPRIEPYFTAVRDCYEAFLLFTFFYLIHNYLAYDIENDVLDPSRVYEQMIKPEPGEYIKSIHSMFPFNYCSEPYPLSTVDKAMLFTLRCKKFVLQCFIVKPLAAVLIIIATQIHSEKLKIITKIFVCISVSFSLYYLIMFYYATKKPLSPYKPLFKFLVIKITLFFTFWQEITLKVFHHHILECFHSGPHNPEKIMIGIENTLVCTEMLLMAIVGGFAFSFHEFKGDIINGKFKEAINDMINTFKSDVYYIVPEKSVQITAIELPIRAQDNIQNIRPSQTPQVVFKQSNISSMDFDHSPSNPIKHDLTKYLIPNKH